MRITTIAFFGLLALNSHSAVKGDAGCDAQSDTGVLDEIFNDRRDLVDWIRNSGGYVDPRQLVRQAYPDDPSSGCGVFAEEQIEAGELLLSVPLKIIVQGEDSDVDSEVDSEHGNEEYETYLIDDSEEDSAEEDNEYEYEYIYINDSGDSEDSEDSDDTVIDSDFCGLMNTLTRELVKGDKSTHGPYIRYMNLQPIDQIPEFWSEGGKQFLATVIGKNLRPDDFIDGYRTSLVLKCGYPVNDLTVRAAMLITTRSDDATMTPYYEIYNHRNGKWHNTVLEWEPSSYNVYAKKTIKKGEEIFNSYNMCSVCGGRESSFDFGTSEVLNDYGFVESYPRRWILSDDIRFDLDEADDGSGNLELTWDRNRQQPSAELIQEELLPELQRLEQISDMRDDIVQRYPGIEENEIETVLIYRDGLIVAMKSALKYYH